MAASTNSSPVQRERDLLGQTVLVIGGSSGIRPVVSNASGQIHPVLAISGARLFGDISFGHLLGRRTPAWL
jgi:hypothetical protein